MILLTSACHRKVPDKIGSERENYRDKLSESATVKKLAGHWKLVATGCGECLNPGIRKADKNVRLIISKDKNFEVYEDNALITQAKFNLGGTAVKEYFQFEVKLPVYSSYAPGIIEFCRDRLAFKNSYMDGTDYYFERIK